MVDVTYGPNVHMRLVALEFLLGHCFAPSIEVDRVAVISNFF
jgi:hypothetical protein